MKDRENLLTSAARKASITLLGADAKFKEMGKFPYGMVRATKGEQRKQYEKLTPEEVMGLVSKYGEQQVNEYLRKQMQGGK